MLSIAAFCQAVPNDNFADEKTRNIVGGRKVLITVTQNAIEPRIDYYLPNRPVTASELYDIRQLTMLAAQESVPLVQALVGYEFTAPLEAALRPTVEKSAWLRPQDVEFSEHGTQDFVLDKLDEANTRQMLLLYTNYHTDPKFAAVIVELKISLLVRKIPKGQYRAGRLKPKYIPYEQIIRSVVRLPDLDSRNLFKLPEAEAQDRRNNVERWAANDGLLARRALHAGIAAVSAMVPISIELDEQQAKEWRSRGDRKTQKVEGVFGWVRERDSKGILMIDARDGAWTRIQIATDLPPSPNSSRDTVLRPQ
jgi:hypothetical protein